MSSKPRFKSWYEVQNEPYERRDEGVRKLESKLIVSVPKKSTGKVQLPPGYTWEQDSFATEGIPMSLDSRMLVSKWSELKTWQKKRFPFLLALACRLPDVAIQAYIGDDQQGTTSSTASFIHLQLGKEIFEYLGVGSSKSKAREDAALGVVTQCDLNAWIRRTHPRTRLSDYSKKA